MTPKSWTTAPCLCYNAARAQAGLNLVFWRSRLPNIKAAIKWARQSERRTIRNRDIKTRLKTLFKKARLSGDATVAAGVESQFDKAAGKGVIHPNKAARKKSRLARAVRAQAALTAAPKVAAKTATRKKTKA